MTVAGPVPGVPRPSPEMSEVRRTLYLMSTPRLSDAPTSESPPGDESSTLTGPTLPPELAELCEIADERRRLDAREARLLADPSTGMACLVEFGHRVPQWLAAATQLSRGAAAKRVRVAERLHGHFPDLLAALNDGRLGWNHAEVFVRAANPRIRASMAELIPHLIDLAAVASFDRWCQEVRGIATLLDQDGGYDPHADPTNNHLRLTPQFDGSVEVSGRLVGELAFRISALIDAETERVLDRHRRDAEVLDDHPDDARPDLPSRGQASAEALCELVERGAASSDDGPLPSPELVVTYDGTTGTIEDHRGERISPTLLRWLVAAAMIRPLEVSTGGDPLRMGRALRYANRAQRRALAVRDGGCVFPGCDRPPNWCDAHHVDHWERGGPTDVENMALMCRHHHRVTHRPGWSMRTSPDDGQGRFLWTTPSGRRLWSEHRW